MAEIDFPSDLRRLRIDELQPVADDLRAFIIDTLSTHPGHLASSLGTVELTVALHYVFNTPDDVLIWDVGHQAYAHKILTGRRGRFDTLRTYGGLSGFPKRSESPYDAFGTGHSSTSVSAALGMATASRLQGNNSRCHIAVIGDGALTGGEAFEGLNNVGTSRANVLVVLNDNGITIDKAVGGLDQYLTRITASRRYNRLKEEVWRRLDGSDGGRRHHRSLGLFQRLTSTAKAVALGSSNLFESLGLRYFGPVDGHDIAGLVEMLRRLKELDGPKLLHVVTTKGKGLRKAEENPVVYHAPGRYDLRTGAQLAPSAEGKPPKYQEVFGRTIIELAEQNAAIVGITPAMATGCSLNLMMRQMPERVFDVGIAEQHAVTFAAGMAASGMVPFCNIYSSFAQRAYDQIIHDVALQGLHVVLCLDRAGLVGDDGPTHHGVFDLAALRPVPGLTVAAPMDEHELRHMMYTAQLPDQGPWAIRYPRGLSEHADWQCPMQALAVGRGRAVREGRGDAAFVTLGTVGCDALRVADEVGADLYDMRFLKPLDTELLDRIGRRGYRRIVTVEDGVRKGGFGEAVLAYLAERHPQAVASVRVLAIDDEFVPHGSVAQLKHACHIDADAMRAAIKE